MAEFRLPAGFFQAMPGGLPAATRHSLSFARANSICGGLKFSSICRMIFSAR
jgi:hypothetical protein